MWTRLIYQRLIASSRRGRASRSYQKKMEDDDVEAEEDDDVEDPNYAISTNNNKEYRENQALCSKGKAQKKSRQ